MEGEVQQALPQHRDRHQRARDLGKAVLEFREVVSHLRSLSSEGGTPREWSEGVLEEMAGKRQANHDLFLDQGWHLAEWAPLRSWWALEDEIVALSALGRQLGQSHAQLLGAQEISGGWEAAIQEYAELAKKLEEGVKYSCPWPQLREAMGEGSRA